MARLRQILFMYKEPMRRLPIISDVQPENLNKDYYEHLNYVNVRNFEEPKCRTFLSTWTQGS